MSNKSKRLEDFDKTLDYHVSATAPLREEDPAGLPGFIEALTRPWRELQTQREIDGEELEFENEI